MDKGSSLNRIEENHFDDCTDSAIDCGSDTPADYNVNKVPQEQLYQAWEWNVPHEFRINTEDLFYSNYIYSTGRNPGFIALRARGTAFTTFYGNSIVADGKIAGVIDAGRNCMTWIIAANSVCGNVEKAYSVGSIHNLRMGGNLRPKSVMPTKYTAPGPSVLSQNLMRASDGLDVSGNNWYRKVTTLDELEKAVRDLPASGGTIYITTGIYNVGSQLVVEDKSNVTIIGSGMSALLRGSGDSDLLVFKGNCRNCYVGNMRIEKAPSQDPAASKTSSGILFTGRGEDFTVDSCIIDGWPLSCIRIEGDPADPIKNVNILSHWIIHGKIAQLYLRGCKGFRIAENQFGFSPSDKVTTGAYLDNCTDGLYEMNYHWNNRYGVHFAQGCENITIRNNRIETNREIGLLMGLAGGATNKQFVIDGNTFHTNSEFDPGVFSHLTATNTSDVKFTANQLYTWWGPRKVKHGVELDDTCRDWLFDSNYVRDHAQSPLKYDAGNGHISKLNYFDARGRLSGSSLSQE